MRTWKPALALGAALAVGGAAGAADRDTVSTAGGSGTTMTLGGKGTAEQAAGEDNELARGYRYGGYYGWGGGYGGYRGYYGGYRGGYYGGYRGGYYNSFYRGGFYGGYPRYYGGGYGGYYGGYRGFYPGFAFSYYRPSYYYSSSFYTPAYYSSYPVYSSSYYDGCSTGGFGFSVGIGGGAAVSGAPTVALGGGLSAPIPQAMPAQPMTAPTAPGDGTFRYDGGPANPVPLPSADPQPMTAPGNTASSTDLPVSLKPKPANSPYKYKAYGEK